MSFFVSANFLLLITINLASAANYERHNDGNHDPGQFQSINSFGGNFVVYSGSGVNSFSQNGGNNVIISRRMGPNQQDDYISVSNPKIRIDGDYFSCSTLTCPPDTFKCVVTSEAIVDDVQNMRTVAECLNKKNEVLEQKEFIEVNPHPGVKPLYSRHTSVARDGEMTTEDSTGNSVINSRKMTKEQQEKFNRDMHNMAVNMQKQQEHFNQQMKQFQDNMQKAFGNGFPFGNNNPFGNGFPFYNGFPFGNGFPFYNYANSYPYNENNYYNQDYSREQ